MTPEEKDQLLDRYVAGHPMSADEETEVRQLLRVDAEFRDEYHLRQTLLDAGIQQRRAAWDARQHSRPAPVKPIDFPMRWAAAASIVLAVGIGLLWWQQTSDADLPLTGQAALYEQRDTQLGLTPADSAVGQVTWIVTKADANAYEFGQADTLRIFSTSPQQWQDQTLTLIRLSEVRYQLRTNDKTYRLEQGRSLRLPLEPEK